MRRSYIVAAALLVAAACNSSGGASKTSGSTAPASLSATPVYARVGPYAVGYTTLKLPDRLVAVWYPADAAGVAGKVKATYDQATPLPDRLKGIVPKQYNTVITMNAYTDVPASTKGPFPVVLFAHGYGGYRLVNSAIDVGIASWGFVVVSVDYLERGIVAQVTGGAKQTREPSAAALLNGARRDERLTLAALDLVTREGKRPGSPLYGAVDATRVAAVGHSAGGGTAFDVLADPRVAVAVGWAPVPPSGAPVDKPTMIIGASGDR
ncbi:MAG TPA: dienelactone hydrolase family protein, partial [Acidimicrobiia bacterium]|nr:dienelactone hydrolase family protein [Acidimicrobiia bacterium]